ncbi:hypothetical protein [Alienimonas chondri]|uniref:Uncharacterized protein n=1 Tax=Alienimonas chondri TaxID=2681879 RepID=A0ABX1V9K2_9PLAN|nr:hypothetical protein [Alienimonas chondri]NNJ24596.1 hypothetical protein [Alienimonas chondri]
MSRLRDIFRVPATDESPLVWTATLLVAVLSLIGSVWALSDGQREGWILLAFGVAAGLAAWFLRPSPGRSAGQGEGDAVGSGAGGLEEVPVTLTPEAARQAAVAAARGETPDPWWIRISSGGIGPKPDGQWGYVHRLDFTTAPESGDVTYRSEGVAVAVPRSDLDVLAGTVLEYRRDPGGFEFLNPNDAAVNERISAVRGLSGSELPAG